MKDYIELTKVKQIGPYALRLTFNDKFTKEIDFLGLIRKKNGLLKTLKEPSEFKKFSIDMAGGLVWKCGVDLGADMLFGL